MSLTELGQFAEAIQVITEARRSYPLDAELLFRQGILFAREGDLSDAVASHRGAISSCEPRHFTSIDPGIKGHKARNNLALILGEMGRYDLAEFEWRTILSERPHFHPAWKGLGECLLAACRPQSLLREIQQRQADVEFRPASLLLQAKLHEIQGELDSARAAIAQAAAEFPNDLMCQ